VVVGYGDATAYGGPVEVANGRNPATTIFAQDAHGYRVGTANGGVFTYGDAQFYGSMGGTTLNAPIIAASGF
jgi:hypothetical protein